MIIENYMKNSMKEKQILLCMQAYFLSFSRLKMYFNYLIVCERLENPWITGHNFVNFEG